MALHGQPKWRVVLEVEVGVLEGLGVLVRRHRADDSVTRSVQAILRARLIVIDDIGRVVHVIG